MLRCPKCFYTTFDNQATSCPHCATSLIGTRIDQSTRFFFGRPTTSGLQLRTEHQGRLSRNDVALYLQDVQGPLILTLGEEIILGRTKSPADRILNLLDLAPFQAMERGVSRAHASLKRYNHGIAIMDMESTNGTWIDQQRLKPMEPFMIRNGARVVLAKLPLYIYFE